MGDDAPKPQLVVAQLRCRACRHVFEGRWRVHDERDLFAVRKCPSCDRFAVFPTGDLIFPGTKGENAPRTHRESLPPSEGVPTPSEGSYRPPSPRIRL